MPDITFAGSIPENYERYMGPLLFEPYAKDMAARLHVPEGGAVLEIACGTGIVTRELRRTLPDSVSLTATDLSGTMLEEAQQRVLAKNVEWRQADAQELPFPDSSFDAVVCQFGIMFFPDKARAAEEARRVLRPGGTYLLNVWNSIESNEVTHAVFESVKSFFPESPPNFFEIPFGYHDRAEITRLLTGAGFRDVELSDVETVGQSPSAWDAAKGLLEGNPLVVQLNELAPGRIDEIRETTAKRLKERFGEPVNGRLSALVVSARK